MNPSRQDLYTMASDGFKRLFAEAMRSGRPLGPGEVRGNGDGSRSTEVSVSQPQADGQWMLAPSLWMVGEEMHPFDEDAAMEIAREYERRQKMAFPRFASQKAMTDYARARSASGSRTTQGSLATPIPRSRPHGL
jgi:hypothetical protein